MHTRKPGLKETNELPMVALIGPSNAGKSTLFNRLTGSWQAVTAKELATTRDRVYGEVEWQGGLFTLVDTGGLVDDDSELTQAVYNQMIKAADEADLILFVYDGVEGLSDRNKAFLDQLRGKKEVILVANKVDSVNREKKIHKLPDIGFPYLEISASSGRGTGDLLDEVFTRIPAMHLQSYKQPIIALIGRPNVGKSTLLNALTESERAVVSPVAGTTRDVVTEKLTLNGKEYLLADTAGVRRRGKIEVGAEKFSVKRTLTAITQSTMVIVVIDASVGTSRGDLHLLYFAHELKKPILLVFNKADLVEDLHIPFHKHAKRFDHVVISALNKQNIEEITEWVEKVTEEAKNPPLD
jgi:GTP-binding protein